MEVTKNQIDDLNIELTIALKAEDYAEQEKKRLSAYRRNADFKGFRKGMVPASLVKKRLWRPGSLRGHQRCCLGAARQVHQGQQSAYSRRAYRQRVPEGIGVGRMATISSSSSTSDCLQRSTLMLTRMTNCRITISR